MEEILKCDICNYKFNLEFRKPLTAKCGHTYCKHCILSTKPEYESSCPICQIPFLLSIETCIPNIKLEEVIKFVFQIPDKVIIYSKPDINRRKSPEFRVNHNHFSKEKTKTQFRSNTITKYQSDFRFSKREVAGLSKNPSGVMTSFQINKIDKIENCNQMQLKYANTNNFSNVKINHFDIDEEKNGNNISETIETIPINDDNNQSFSDEFKELLKKESKEITNVNTNVNTNTNSNGNTNSNVNLNINLNVNLNEKGYCNGVGKVNNGIYNNLNVNHLDISSKASIEEEKKEEDDDGNDNNNENEVNTSNNNKQDEIEDKDTQSKVEAVVPLLKKKPTNKEEALEKLLNDIDKIFSEGNYTTSTTAKRKKFEEQIQKAVENDKFKNDYEALELKLFPNGDFFIGYLDNNNDKITNGVLYGNNGDYYEGEFINDKKEGYGILVYKNGTRYEGVLKNNKHNGYGKLIQLDGEVFIGEWKDGKINGNGVRYHSNGDRYIGCYINNIRNGNGHYIFTNGDSYEGNWSNGKANGKGKFTFKNGNIYEGEFVDNVICGKGVFTMSTGDVYTGTFKNGLINGRGSLRTKKGEKYLGEFFNGKKHGNGKMFNADGTVLCAGQWNLDKFIGRRQVNEYI